MHCLKCGSAMIEVGLKAKNQPHKCPDCGTAQVETKKLLGRSTVLVYADVLTIAGELPALFQPGLFAAEPCNICEMIHGEQCPLMAQFPSEKEAVK